MQLVYAAAAAPLGRENAAFDRKNAGLTSGVARLGPVVRGYRVADGGAGAARRNCAKKPRRTAVSFGAVAWRDQSVIQSGF